ncbi:hypothetical protein BpHYR1_016644 [Brachionus plicatilis]|uniref:Uncharacterized protein n=1 Tax=Brachionus plicatilis TaxID=10195 RepID=A0A3M7Q3T1_BRAPC|nr:hypothetical protein BpHYR1_016644 [Brachionus plicatilis]
MGRKQPIVTIKPHKHNATIKTQVKAVQSNIRELTEKQPDTKPRQIILQAQSNLSDELSQICPLTTRHGNYVEMHELINLPIMKSLLI